MSTRRRPLSRAFVSCLAAGLLGACGGGHSPAAPTAPAVSVATPPPDSLSPGAVIQVVSAEDAAPIDGAAVTIAGKSYTSAAGRITLQERVALRSEVGILAGGMLERRTLVRDAAMSSFALWPTRSPTGMDEGYTQALVYTSDGDFSPLRRLMRGTTRVAVVLSAELRTDAEAVAAHQEAADRMTAASGGRVAYALATQAPASGAWVEVKLGSGDPYCYNGHGGVDFGPRESLVMRLMLQRPAGNVFPDDDRTAAAAMGERPHTTICRTAPR